MKWLKLFFQICMILLVLKTFSNNSGEIRAEMNMSSNEPAIHYQSIVIDGHNDLPQRIRTIDGFDISKLNDDQQQSDIHTDIPRLIKGGVDAQFWAAYVPVDEIRKNNSAKYALEQIDLIHRFTNKFPDVFEMAYSAEDIERIVSTGKIASLIGIEGGHAIENSLAILRKYYRLGARYMTLTHSQSLEWADSATDDPIAGGLSEFGEKVVHEMNHIGMLVDISHVSADTMRDVLKVSKAPVIASHSSAFHVAPHPRNVPDDVLKMIKENGGVIMVNFFSGYVVPESAKILWEWEKNDKKDLMGQDEPDFPKGDVSVVVDHIDHIAKVAGIDHVGIGSDYDGINALPGGLEDVSKLPNLTKKLIENGYSEEDISKILGGNFLRVFKQAEEIANQ